MATPTGKRSATTSRNVDCTDLADRRRNVTTYTSHDRIVLIAPPGEAAKMTPAEARELAHHLLDEAMSLDHGRDDPFRRWLQTQPDRVVSLRRS